MNRVGSECFELMEVLHALRPMKRFEQRLARMSTFGISYKNYDQFILT